VPLLEVARGAFIDGIHVSALISVIGALALAAMCAVWLRRRGVGAEPVAEDAEGAAEEGAAA
jgi:hypothetical protein